MVQGASPRERQGAAVTATLRIYGQHFLHQAAFVVGDEAGLRALRNVIDRALGDATGSEAFDPGDGELYELHVICTSPVIVEALASHYAQGQGTDGMSPYSLLDIARKKRTKEAS